MTQCPELLSLIPEPYALLAVVPDAAGAPEGFMLRECNAAFARAVGGSPEELRERPLAEAVPVLAELELSWPEIYHRCREGKGWISGEVTLRRGGARQLVKVFSEHPSCLLISLQPPKAAAAGSGRGSLAAVRQMLETVPMGAVIIDPGEHRIVYANPRSLALFGASRETVVGSVCHQFICAAEIGRCPVTDLGQEIDKSERVLLRADGSALPIAKTVMPMVLDGRDYLVETFVPLQAGGKSAEVLRETEEIARLLQQAPYDAILLVSADGTILAANEVSAQQAGKTRQQLLGQSLLQVFAPELARGRQNRLGLALQQKRTVHFEDEHAGSCYEVTIFPVLEPGGEAERATLFVQDVTERRQLESELRLARSRYRELFEQTSDLVYVYHLEAGFLAVNHAFERASGYTREELRGVAMADLICPDSYTRFRDIVRNRLKGGEWLLHDMVLLARDGRRLELEVSSRQLWAGGRPYALQGIARDVTERNELERRLRYLTSHDALTGLYNRSHFWEEMRKLEEEKKTPVGLVICEIDGLRLVSEHLGHQAGDVLVWNAARLIRNTLRRDDMVCRIDSNEFAVVLWDAPNLVAERVASRMREMVSGYNSHQPPVPLSLSVGWAVYSDPAESVSALVKRAESHMRQEQLLNRELFRELFSPLADSLAFNLAEE